MPYIFYPKVNNIRASTVSAPNPHHTPGRPTQLVTGLEISTQAGILNGPHVRRYLVVSRMEGSGSESFTSRSADPELIPCGHEEEMAIQLALRRS